MSQRFLPRSSRVLLLALAAGASAAHAQEAPAPEHGKAPSMFGVFDDRPPVAPRPVAAAPAVAVPPADAPDPSLAWDLDAKKASNAIFKGIRKLPPLTGGVKALPYGAGAVSLVDQWEGPRFAGSSLVAAAWGKGRVVALAGHRRLQTLGKPGDEAFDPLFLNCVAFAAGSDAKDIPIIVCDTDAQARNAEAAWLRKQGYTAIVAIDPMNAKSAAAGQAALKTAKLLIGRSARLRPELAADIAAFVKAGGGLFLAESGHTELLREPGIGFVGLRGNFQARRAGGFLARPALEKLLAGALLSAQEAQVAGNLLFDLADSLPPADPLARRCTQAILDRAARVFPDADQVYAPAPFDLRCLSREGELLLKLPAEEIVRRGPHRMADGFGRIPADAQPVTRTVVAADRGACCTGLYALPGQGVKITVQKELVGKVSFMVGHHAWPFLGAFRGQDIHAMPHCRFTFPCTAETTLVASPFGGLIYVFPAKDTPWQDVPLTVAGAIESPSFTLGKTTPAQWARLKNAPAPWGEVAATRFNTVLPAFHLQRLADPTPGIAQWNEAMRVDQACLQSPVIAARYQADLFPVGGAAWMPQGMMTGRTWTLLDPRWGISSYFMHEFGHTVQVAGVNTPPGAGEASNNWAGYTAMGMEARAMGANAVAAVRAAAEATRTGGKYFPGSSHGNSTPWTNIISGYVFNFGWDAFWKAPAALKALTPEARKGDGQTTRGGYDLWLREWSKAAGHDVRPYFARFGITATPPMDAEIDALHLPKWDFLFHPGLSAATAQNQPVRLPSPLTHAFSAEGKATCAWVGKPAHGTLAPAADGSATYTPNAGFTGQDRVGFTLTNGLGYTDTFAMTVHVTPPGAADPALSMGRVAHVGCAAWTPMRFARAYKHPILLTTPWQPGSHEVAEAWSQPVTVRVRNLTADGCEVKLQRLDGQTDDLVQDVSFLAMEAGLYQKPKSGLWLEAGDQEVTVSNPRTGMRANPTTTWRLAPKEGNFGAGPWAQLQTTHADVPAYARTPWMPKANYGAILLAYAPGPDAPAKPETLGYAVFGQGLHQLGGQVFEVTSTRVTCGKDCVINPEADPAVKYREAITKGVGFQKTVTESGFVPQVPANSQAGLIDTWHLCQDRQAPTTFKDLTMNVTGKLTGPGDYAVQFLCGNCEPMDIQSVVLTKNGAEVARDNHADAFGLPDRLPARYLLKLADHDPQAVYKLHVVLRLRAHVPENDGDRSAAVHLFKLGK